MKREKMREKKGKKREREENWSKVGDVIFFSSPSSFPSALQVVARERSQRKPRTSKF